MNKYLILKKNGKFYNSYNDDAIILNYLLHYKLVGNRIGFPTSSLNKVKLCLESKKISYKIIENEAEEEFNNGNKYDEVLAKAKKYKSLDDKKEFIYNTLETKDNNFLETYINITYYLVNMNNKELNNTLERIKHEG